MKIELQYVNNAQGEIQSVQMPITDWEKVCNKMLQYEQSLKLKKDLTIAFKQVEHIKKSKAKKQSLKDFLNEL